MLTTKKHTIIIIIFPYHHHQLKSMGDLRPEVLALGPPIIFNTHEEQFTSKFRFLKPFESQLPLPQFLESHAQNTKAAICSGGFKLSAAVLRHLPALRLLVTSSAGINQIDVGECRLRGISVANTAKIYSADVADLAVGLVIDVLRKISSGNRFVKSGSWVEQGIYTLGSKLGGKHVGIVGLGSIGLQVAKRLQAFGCTISYLSRKKKPSVSYSFYSDIHELATKSDILVLCCALNDKTLHMINREVLLALGKEGVIVNIARGAVIDEKELIQCLQQGDIAGAGLDVFEHEPRVPKELFDLDNVVLTPHAAVYTVESFRDCYELMVGNLEAFFSNKPLLSLVPNE